MGACLEYKDNPEQCEILTWTRRCVAIVSFFCSAGVIFFIWLLRKYLSFAQRLILYLAISAMAESIQFMLDDTDNLILCRIRGYFENMFAWMALLWIIAITINLSCLVYKNLDTSRYEWIYHSVCWGFPFLFSLLPFFSNKYGDAGVWCWIVNDTAWRMAMWYGPLFVIMFLMIVLYGSLVFKHRRKLRSGYWAHYTPQMQEDKEMHERNIRPIFIYPFIFICVSIFPVIYRIQDAIDPIHPAFVLNLLASIAGPLQGTLNAIAFSCDRITRQDFTATKMKLAWHSRWNTSVPRDYGHDEIEHITYDDFELATNSTTNYHGENTYEDVVTENGSPTTTTTDVAIASPNGNIVILKDANNSATLESSSPPPVPLPRRSRIKHTTTNNGIQRAEPITADTHVESSFISNSDHSAEPEYYEYKIDTCNMQEVPL